MNSKVEEYRIVISDVAVKDVEVEALQDRFVSVSTSLSVFAHKQDAEAYTVAAEELCRISRRIIWEFVRSGSCNEGQVVAAMNLFEACDFGDIEAAREHMTDVADFVDAIRGRANQLRVVIESHQSEMFSEPYCE